MLRMWRVAAVLLVLAMAAMAGGEEAGADVKLSPARRTLLHKASGRVDQVILLPSGGFLVRDADFYDEKTQALEVYDRSGRLQRKIGGFGQRPGSYYRLKGIALADDTVLVADVIGRVTLYSEQGAFLGTKLVQDPGFQVDGIAVDEEKGFLYLGGCLPKSTYVDFGCKVVHQFRLKDKKYLRSFAETDPAVVSGKLMALSDVSIDVDSRGRVAAVDAPSFKLLRVEPKSGKVEALPIQSRKARPIGKLEGAPDWKAVHRTSFLIERVVTAGPYAVVAISLPERAGSLLAVFDGAGRQVAVDLDPPGKLVGKTPAGGLLFAVRKSGGYEITEHAIASRPQR